jgi:membrane-associated phospholipid phosphatase
VAQYGLGPANLSAVPSAAGAARFDALLGWHYFQGFYTRSHNVFGAMPSLHAAYPTVVLLSVWTVPRWWARAAAGAFAVLVAFAAVYLDHHYVLDVVAGVTIALVTYAVVWRILQRRI